MNKYRVISVVLFVVIIIFIVVDYNSLFGTREVHKPDFIEMRFKIIDESTGAPVLDAKARCFQKNNQNACTQRDSKEIGIVSINIPVQKIIKKTILFKKDSQIQKTRDPKIHVMFIHKNYANPVETIYIDELTESTDNILTVKMPKSIRDF